MSSLKVGACAETSGFHADRHAVRGRAHRAALDAGDPGLDARAGRAQSASALGTLQVVNSAQLSFAITCGLGFYSPDFQTLGVTPPAAIDAFLPPEMSAAPTFIKSGYTFSLAGTASPARRRPATGLARGGFSGYAVVADPLDTTPQARFFGTNADGIIYRRYGELLARPCPRPAPPPAGAPIQVSTSRLDADARAANAARHVGRLAVAPPSPFQPNRRYPSPFLVSLLLLSGRGDDARGYEARQPRAGRLVVSAGGFSRRQPHRPRRRRQTSRRRSSISASTSATTTSSPPTRSSSTTGRSSTRNPTG